MGDKFLTGVMIEPKSAIAFVAAAFPWSDGTNIPLTTSFADGLRYVNSPKKQAAMVNMKPVMMNSSLRAYMPSTTCQSSELANLASD
jgi:hypothetical protein